MYKNVSNKWDKNIYKNRQSVMNIYFDNVLINPDYITAFKKGNTLFDKELELGSTPSQYVELQIHKRANIQIPKQIKIEYGILINNALTVAEVNSMLVGTLNGIPIKSLSANDSSFEMIPIGIYNVDDYNDEDDNVINIKALDNMIKFEFNYDGSELISQNGKATLLQVAQDICNKAGVELGSTSFLNSEKQVAVYDNQITDKDIEMFNNMSIPTNVNLESSNENNDRQVIINNNGNVNYLKENNVDIDASLELLGDMEMYNETLQTFIEENKARIPRIEKNKQEVNMKDYSVDVHALKSDCKYLGFKTLAELAYNHEMKSKENDINYINEHYNELIDEYNRIKSIIDKYL